MGNILKKYIIVSEKDWHDELSDNLRLNVPGNWFRIKSQDEFVLCVESIKPDIIFFPHWSYLIPQKIFENYESIVFHMTDLPFGRGGSPLQNLIVRGYKTTVISALKVAKGIDTGDIYLKRELSLQGTAKEILLRASGVMEQMIKEIINLKIQPQPQTGDVTIFERRKPEDGNISNLTQLEKVYDYIRMLDCEGYPNAFLEVGNLRFEFNKATLNEDNILHANVRITKK